MVGIFNLLRAVIWKATGRPVTSTIATARADLGRQEDWHRRRPGPRVRGGQSAAGWIPEGRSFFLNIKGPELLNK